MQIQFLGAAQTVTGSKYLIQADHITMLVDCGLFQGLKELRTRNWKPFPIDPQKIDYVFLTHAHIDHSGYIPLLVKNGFRGKIICTEATYELCKILLPDSGYLQEEEARYANLKGYSKHKPALPLYTKEEAEASLAYFSVVEFDKTYEIMTKNTEKVSYTFYYGGHILGAAFVRIVHQGKSILFSGDLGRSHDPIMHPPENPVASDYLVIESTYGDRKHIEIDPKNELANIINKTAKRGGVIVIPAFAVGRAQHILFYVHQLIQEKKIPSIPVFIDSPMATDATKLFYRFSNQHRLSASEAMKVCQTAQYMHTKEESMSLNNKNMPMIIISASGMATGGRILHHIKNFGPNHRNSLVFCGYQAAGTRGEQIMSGAETVKIFGQDIPLHAEIIQLDNMSAHADSAEMLSWLSHLKSSKSAGKQPKKVFITHGEYHAALALKEKIESQLHWPCVIPNDGDSAPLT